MHEIYESIDYSLSYIFFIILYIQESKRTKNKYKEIFLDFVKAFHNDSTFMRARIKDRINGFNSDDYVIEDTLKNEYVWSEEDILFYMKDINEAYHNSKYKKEYKTLQNGNIEEYIYIPNSSCFYKCIFRFSEKKWYLCELIVNTL